MEDFMRFLESNPDLKEKLARDGIEKFLDFLGDKRLFHKKERMRNLLKIAQADEALYREIMLALGYKNNKIQFLELAMILPYSEIRKLKEKNRIEQALLYRAGFINTKEELPEDFDFSLKMDKSVWNYKGIRPLNFPDRRIRSISGFLSESCNHGFCEPLRERIEKNYAKSLDETLAIKVVGKIAKLGGVGKTRSLEIFFNIVLPFFVVIYENEAAQQLVAFLEELYLHHPPLGDNSITQSMKKLVFTDKPHRINSVRQYMGLIQLYNELVKEEEYGNT